MKLRLTLHDKGRFQDLFERYGELCKDNATVEPINCPHRERQIIGDFWEDFEALLGDMFEVTCEEIPENEVDGGAEAS